MSTESPVLDLAVDNPSKQIKTVASVYRPSILAAVVVDGELEA